MSSQTWKVKDVPFTTAECKCDEEKQISKNKDFYSLLLTGHAEKLYSRKYVIIK